MRRFSPQGLSPSHPDSHVLRNVHTKQAKTSSDHGDQLSREVNLLALSHWSQWTTPLPASIRAFVIGIAVSETVAELIKLQTDVLFSHA